MKKVSIVLLSLLLTAALVFSGCDKAEQAQPHDPNLDVLEHTLVAADAAALQELDIYVNLQTLDLRGSDCYEAIESYIAAHPQVKVIYDVEVAGVRYSPDVQQLKLEDGTFEPDALLAVMKHLPKLECLELPKTGLSFEQLAAIREAYPNLTVIYTVELLGQEVSTDLAELDLSGLTAEELDDQLLEKLRLLTGLARVQLMQEDGTTNFAPVDVKNLMNVLPGVAMDYSFQLFGQTVTTADERVEFKNTYIGDEGIPEIRAALDILPNCTYFLMDNCGVDNEVMAQLRADYPNSKVVWRVFWRNKYHVLTDTEMINSNGVRSEDIEVLKYCNDVIYLDIGHSDFLDSIEVVKYMPKLKVCICVDSKITDLSPLVNCPDLEVLEIVACRKITDLSPLVNCTKLKGINMSMAYGIEDITPLYSLENMERLYLGSNNVPDEMFEEACEKMPNCWVTDNWYDSSGVYRNYAVGWRLDPKGRFAEWYLEMREIFRYTEYYYSGKGEKIKQL